MYRRLLLTNVRSAIAVLIACIVVAVVSTFCAGWLQPARVLASSSTASQVAGLEACWPWVQVNQDAFGLGAGPDGTYNAEEGFEVLVFNDQLYLGMEADNSLGARLWRTREGVHTPDGQADWEEVIADGNGYPFGVSNPHQNDHVDSLAEFGGYLYASTANGGSYQLGTRLFRSLTGAPGSWQDAIASYGAGFGDLNNTNFKDMQVFEGWLCGGTENDTTGAQVWCTLDGATWLQKNRGGFGIAEDDSSNVKIWSGFVYDGNLYFGVQNNGLNPSSDSDDVARLFRTSDLDPGEPQWTQVYNGAPGSYRVDILGELDQALYISVRSASGIVILRSADGGTGSWEQVNQSGMGLTPDNLTAVVDGATLYNGGLYVAVSNFSSGFQLWRTDGSPQCGGPQVDWERVGGDGLTDNHNIHAELIEFNGWLYAWTSNFTSGQQVLRSNCPLGGSYYAFLPILLQTAP
jgi:hypothetical protein